MEYIGWLAALLGIMYPIPQCYKIIKYGSALGISKDFILLFLAEKVLKLFYAMYLTSLPLMVDYSLGIIYALIFCYYKFYLDKKRQL